MRDSGLHQNSALYPLDFNPYCRGWVRDPRNIWRASIDHFEGVKVQTGDLQYVEIQGTDVGIVAHIILPPLRKVWPCAAEYNGLAVLDLKTFAIEV